MKNKVLKFGFTLTLLIAAILLLVPMGMQWFSGRISDDGSLVTFKPAKYSPQLIFQSNDLLMVGLYQSIQYRDVRTGRLLREKKTDFPVSRWLGGGQYYIGSRKDKKNKRFISIIVRTDTGKNVNDLTSHTRQNGWINGGGQSADGTMTVTPFSVDSGPVNPDDIWSRKRIAVDYLEARNAITGKQLWLKEIAEVENDVPYFGVFIPYKYPGAFSPDGKLFAYARVISQSPVEAAIIFLDARTGQEVRTLCETQDHNLGGSRNIGWQKLQFSPDGSLLIAVGGDSPNNYAEDNHTGAIYAFDTTTGELKWKGLKSRSVPTILEFSLDGSLLACSNEIKLRPGGFVGGEITLWDTRTGELLRTLSRETRADYLAMLKDVKKRQLDARFPQLASAKPNKGGRLPSDKSFPIYSLAFSPDSTLLAAAHEGGEVKIWPVP